MINNPEATHNKPESRRTLTAEKLKELTAKLAAIGQQILAIENSVPENWIKAVDDPIRLEQLRLEYGRIENQLKQLHQS